jgi:hypothetical protein
MGALTMETSDYYCPTTVTSTLGYTMGRGVGAVKTITVETIETINPLKAGIVVGAVWGGIAALLNARKYKRGRISKRDAVLDTAGEATGLGLASGMGLLASNAVRASTLLISASSIIPFTVGVAVTAGSKAIWDCNVKRHLKCEAKPA